MLLLLAAEFVLFDQVGARHHSWIYPRWNDQVQYLTECYTGWEFMKAHGFWAGVWRTLVNPSAQGTLHDFAGVLAFAVAGGPSRSALLALNILALIAWQAAGFLAVRRVTGSRSLAWAAAALPLTLGWPWNGWAGSMADFRLDHFAMCAFGTALACAQLTAGFRSLRWSLLFGAVVGLTLLTRFLTGTYFLLVFLSLGAWFASRPEGMRRTGNLTLAALVAFALAAPFFWLNRDWVWNYYWIGHFTGPESAIRSPHMNLIRSLEFVWYNLRDRHLGPSFWSTAGLATFTWIVVAGWAWWRSRQRPADFPAEHSGEFAVAASEHDAAGGRPGASEIRDWLVVSTVFTLAPAVVLTLHSQKSEIVLGAIVPGVIGLVLAAWWSLLRFAESGLPVATLRRCGAASATLACILAAIHFTRFIHLPPVDGERTADLRSINQLADLIYDSAAAAKLSRPSVGVNQISISLDAQVLRVICYERHRRWVPFEMTLPTGITEAEERLIMERLAQSDFLLVVVDGPVSQWPYDRQQRSLLPKVRAWCEAHRRVVAPYEIFGHRMVLYQRREFPFPSRQP